MSSRYAYREGSRNISDLSRECTPARLSQIPMIVERVYFFRRQRYETVHMKRVRMTYGAQTVAMKERHLMRRQLLGVVAPNRGTTGTMVSPALACILPK